MPDLMPDLNIDRHSMLAYGTRFGPLYVHFVLQEVDFDLRWPRHASSTNIPM